MYRKMFALGAGLALGASALVAAAPAEAPEVEPAPVVEPLELDMPTTLPEVEEVVPEVPEGWIVCGPNEWLNEAGDGCELMPEVEAPEVEIEAPAMAPVESAGLAPEEDQEGWDCATQGNRICGPGADWNGFVVGDVIVCPPGLRVATDTTADGTEWAACM